MMNASNLVMGDRELAVPPTGASVQNLPSITWPVMSVDRYAAFEQALGTKLLRTGDIWWVQIRPFFYRPLLPFERYDVEAVKKLVGHRGVFQHAVMEGQAHNCYLNPIIFGETQSYTLETLRKDARRNLRRALGSGACVRPITDEQEFCERAYPTYLSFYQRTGYQFDDKRRERTEFSKWAQALFQSPETLVFGVFAGPELIAIQITCLVENTLLLKGLITSDLALRLKAADLLLHCCRLSAAKQRNVHQIYCGMHSQNAGLNRYKVERGASALALSASVHNLNTIFWSMMKAKPALYLRLHGLDEAALTVYYSRPETTEKALSPAQEQPA